MLIINKFKLKSAMLYNIKYVKYIDFRYIITII